MDTDETRLFAAGRIQVLDADITTLEVDAIVNAANRTLQGGGGVDGAIHRAAGPELLAACKKIGPIQTGEVRVTPGFSLPARHVLHAVGPVWKGGGHGEDALLTRCYRTSLDLAAFHGFYSVAFPAISTGVYGFPEERAARIACAAVKVFMATHARPHCIVFCGFGAEPTALIERVVREVFAG